MSTSLVKVIDPPDLGSLNPSYGNITVVPIGDTNLITIAGQVATTPSGEIPSSLEEQFDLCLHKVQTCLSFAGATLHDMTRLVYYVVEYDGDSTRRILVEKITAFLQGHRPASCLLIVKALSKPEFKVEIEASAVTRRQ